MVLVIVLVIVFCRVELLERLDVCNDRGIETIKKWANKAADAGYRNIAIYSEGFQVWKTNKMPIAPLTNHR